MIKINAVWEITDLNSQIINEYIDGCPSFRFYYIIQDKKYDICLVFHKKGLLLKHDNALSNSPQH